MDDTPQYCVSNQLYCTFFNATPTLCTVKTSHLIIKHYYLTFSFFRSIFSLLPCLYQILALLCGCCFPQAAQHVGTTSLKFRCKTLMQVMCTQTTSLLLPRLRYLHYQSLHCLTTATYLLTTALCFEDFIMWLIFLHVSSAEPNDHINELFST